MKTMNWIIFILVFNMMCGVVAVIPDNSVDQVNSGRNLFSDTSFESSSTAFNATLYNDTASGDKSTDYTSVFGKFLFWAKSAFNKLYNAMFGLPHLLRMSVGGSPGNAVNLVISGLNVVVGAMWILLIAWLYKGAVIE